MYKKYLIIYGNIQTQMYVAHMHINLYAYLQLFDIRENLLYNMSFLAKQNKNVLKKLILNIKKKYLCSRKRCNAKNIYLKLFECTFFLE